MYRQTASNPVTQPRDKSFQILINYYGFYSPSQVDRRGYTVRIGSPALLCSIILKVYLRNKPFYCLLKALLSVEKNLRLEDFENM